MVRVLAHGAMGCRSILHGGARYGSVVTALAHGAMGRRIDPSWWTH